MALVKSKAENIAKIKVLGVGGAGGNSLNSMISHQKIQGVEFIAVNTDAQALAQNQAPLKLQVGEELTKGLGSGGNPQVGKEAAEESLDQIKNHLEGADMVFITAGMGGGTGTGASPVIASVAKDLGSLTVGVVTKPFEFEGGKRMEIASQGIADLREKVDALIVVPNQRLLEFVEKTVSILDAFKVADSVLAQGVQGISDLIVVPGLINVDFADVKTIMASSGSALLGIGMGEGEEKSSVSAKAAISSPLLEVSVDGATGILFNVVGGPDLSMHEVDEAARIVSASAAPGANIIFGATIDPEMESKMKIIVIATGFALSEKPTKEKAKEEELGLEEPEEDEFSTPAFLRRKK